ncbi:ATP-binding protein [Aquabacterium humicola]|uniref:ATP-binding protein n=1 Tax=Aquabacterium humicola TaxID=3237377 RepID=UPI0025438BCA|nr:tetratricopeptide repeat protein [Rubrivivax pictus]
MSVRLILFGAPAVAGDAGPQTLPSERRSQLLVFLACRRDWVGRAELAALLWPELDNAAALANLRKTLHRLQLVGWALEPELQGNALRLVVATDVAAFDAAIAGTRFDDALALRRGEFLAGFDDDANPAWTEWLRFERHRLRDAWRGAALARLADPIEPVAALALAAQLLEADPLDEAAVSAQMSWLGRSGQAARAHQVYREFAVRLQAELGLAPGTALKALHETLAGADAADARVGAVARHSAATAADADGFVGRSVELAHIAELLQQPGCRLLCLLGPGGAGKTRLARRALAQLAPRFADGATWIGFEDLRSADEIGPRLARELGVKLAGNRDPIDQVIAALAGCSQLLALDNLEQLDGAAAAIERLLQGCTGLTLLATSRVRLSIADEWLLPIDGLPCPEDEDVDRVEAFDAARLFIHAARRVEPALQASAEAAAIVAICRLTGGLPLALELAAGWTRVLSCEAIAAELQQGTELLRAVDATRPSRHASIEAVFEHSWSLLTTAERETLARLAVFRGGCSFEAARALAGAPLPVLGALVDKSLLRKDGARLSLHPLVQQMVEPRLAAGGEEQAARRAHAQYFHHLLRQLKRAAEHGEREALARIDTELENCRAAWLWTVAQGDLDSVRGSASTLADFYDHRCRFADGLALLQAALAAPALADRAPPWPLLQALAAHLELRRDRYAEAEAMARPAAEAARAADDVEAEVQSCGVLGASALRLGRYDEARPHFERALALAPPQVDPHGAGAMLHNLAVLASEQGRYDDALRLMAESLQVRRQIGDVAGEAAGLVVLGIAHLKRRDLESARLRLGEALALCERHDLVTLRTSALGALVEHARTAGDFATAERHALRALELARANGYRALMMALQFDLGHIALHRGDPDAALVALGEGLRMAIAIARPTWQIAGVALCAQILASHGETACAAHVMRAAVAHPLAQPADREDHLALLAAWQANGPHDAPAPAFDELVRRIDALAGHGLPKLAVALRPPPGASS